MNLIKNELIGKIIMIIIHVLLRKFKTINFERF